ncbi:prosaposin-like [Achroia grisella]|uniref:prosaposin-like n=1 Tax=Achroia grisella TaxID=688607 RepID=UPI0027D324EB|nr:prosaposin-like [Achroia grisella]
MDVVKKEIKGKKNKEEIKNLVHNICKKVPKLVRHECHKFIDKHADHVIDMLVDKVDPKKVCHKLNLCQVMSVPSTEISINVIFDVSSQVEYSKGLCKVCKIVMDEVKKEIKGKNEEEIKNLVHNICKNVPKLVRHECHKFVDKYADHVIDMLVNKLDPKEVCHKLNLCQVLPIHFIEQLYKIFYISTQVRQSKEACGMCKKVMTTIERTMQNIEVVRT